MDSKLFFQALFKFTAGFLIIVTLLFLPAGTLCYPNGWLLCGLLFFPMLLLGCILLIKSPDLLRRRLDTKEQAAAQKSVVGFSALIFLAGFILAGLDFRFGWSAVPEWAVFAASVLFLASYALYAEVMRENAYLSRTVTVQEGQQVIDTGLYGIVRHPMYAATLFLFLSIPVILGSWYALLAFLFYPALLVIRIIHEEKVLESGLSGYTEYKKRVKYRLIPFVW